MLVQLDKDTWEVDDMVRLDEVLADISDRAQAQGRLVTQLIVGNRPMTDRELVPVALAKAASSFGSIEAKSERMDSIIQHSEETAKQFGQQIRIDAEQLVAEFRQGTGVLRALDQWFGKIADYLEWMQVQQAVAASSENRAANLSVWVSELMNARQAIDHVQIADVLEYEVIPLLPR